MSRIIENNKIDISGRILSELQYSHEVFGEKFYTTKISAKRLSGTNDVVQIVVPEKLINTKDKLEGKRVNVIGQIRSYNENNGSRGKVIISIFPSELLFIEDEGDDSEQCRNEVCLSGFICKEPTYRKTPNGREISDLILAVNRPYGKTDYIPCITWGRNAGYANFLEIGTRIKIEGRLQSREYIKKFEDGTRETRTAYEVSVSEIKVLEETEVSNADL